MAGSSASGGPHGPEMTKARVDVDAGFCKKGEGQTGVGAGWFFT